MEGKTPGPSKGYQKQIKEEKSAPLPKPKTSHSTDYSSPMAKKIPLFFDAIENGKADIVTQLIEEGINVNLMRDGVTPLMVAASKGRKEIAETLLQAGANINEKTDDGWTALHKAASDQVDAGIIHVLMESGIDIEAKNKSGKAALQVAEEKGHRDIVRIMKIYQAKLRAEDQEWGEFLNTPEGEPYKQSRRFDSLELVFRLWWLPFLVLGCVGLLVGFLFNRLVLSVAIGAGLGLLIGIGILIWKIRLRRYLDNIGPLPYLDIHMVRAKRKAGEPITIENLSRSKPAESAVEDHTADISVGSRTNSFSDTLIEKQKRMRTPAGRKRGLLKIVLAASAVLVLIGLVVGLIFYKDSLTTWYFTKKLEKTGIQFTQQTFLDEVSKNNEKAVDLFMKAGIDASVKNDQGQTALIISTERGYANLLQKLLMYNASLINHADKNGNTALMLAARLGSEQIVKMLFENGADVNYSVPSNQGPASALQAVVVVPDFKEEHMRIVHYLLQQGANVRNKNASGKFPLLFAAEQGRTEVVKLFIEKGADVNDTDLNGLTPLMCAVQENKADTVKLLLSKRAAIDAKNAQGFTALSIATKAGNVEIAKMLLAQGADPGNGQVPDSFLGLRGSVIIVSAKKTSINEILKRIAKTASRDGYTIIPGTTIQQKVTVMVKAPWNKVLHELAIKNRLLLVVKDKEVFVLPAAIR